MMITSTSSMFGVFFALAVRWSTFGLDRRRDLGSRLRSPFVSDEIIPTIVRISIRPYALPSDDPALNKKRLGVAISRRLSTDGSGVVRDDQARRMGCCTGVWFVDRR